VKATLQALRDADVDVVTFGQYLRPRYSLLGVHPESKRLRTRTILIATIVLLCSRRHMKMQESITPEAFDEWKVVADGMGFK
jgi:lipoate synthase